MASPLVGTSAGADRSGQVKQLYTAARFALLDGELDQAWRFLVSARELDPNNNRVITLMARVLVDRGQVDQAIDLYDSLINRDPKLFGSLLFQVAPLLARQKRYDEAMERLKTAEKIDAARAIREQGLIWLNAKRFDRAVAEFDRLAALPALPADQKQEAGYLAAQAELGRREFQAARDRLARARRIDPQSERVKDIDSLAKTVDRAERAARPWRVYLSAAYRYDDNVFLNSFESDPAGLAPTSQADSSLQTNVNFSYKLLDPTDGWKLGLTAGAGRLGYFNETAADFSNLSAGLFVERLWPKVSLYIPYVYTHYWAGATLANRVAVQGVMPRLGWQTASWLRTEISARLLTKSYYDTTPDAVYYGLGAVHLANLGWQQSFLRLGYQFNIEQADDSRSGYRVFELSFGGGINLYGPVYLDAGLTWASYTYDSRPAGDYGLNQTGDVTRRDSQIRVNVRLSCRVAEGWQIGAGYYFTTNDSDLDFGVYDPFKFRKNMFSLSVIGTF